MTPRGNAIISRILIAADDSEYSARVLLYVGSLLREARDVQVIPISRPEADAARTLGTWRIRGTRRGEPSSHRIAVGSGEVGPRGKRVTEYPILVKALELFGKTGFPLDRVTLKFGHEGDIAHTILDEARTGGHGTIVISRQGSNGLKRFFGGGITDRLLREASGYTLWVVE